MTNFRKAFCVLLSIVFFCVLALVPGPYFLRGDVFRQLPLYGFLKDQTLAASARADRETDELLAENNAAYLGQQMKAENGEAAVVSEADVSEKEVPKTDVSEAEVSGTDAFEEEVPGTDDPETDVSATDTSEADVPVAEETPAAALAADASEAAVAGTAAVPAIPQAHPVIDLSPEVLADEDYLLQEFYIVDEQTEAREGLLDAVEFLEKDLSISKEGDAPQIAIYHSHSQETFADSREGERADTIVGVGDYLTELLEDTYGYSVLHVTEAFDIINGELDRSRAYDTARAYMEEILEKNPSVQVVIDLHRDGVPENRRLVTEINGKPTAQIMFYNGLSYTLNRGELTYLPNPYLSDNLAFSFQLEYQAALYYPEFYRGIYLAGYRYNLHLMPRALLLEAGAQTNTVQEVKNAMEPFAQILDQVLQGKLGENGT